jgi:hypothetical protein
MAVIVDIAAYCLGGIMMGESTIVAVVVLPRTVLPTPAL